MLSALTLERRSAAEHGVHCLRHPVPHVLAVRPGQRRNRGGRPARALRDALVEHAYASKLLAQNSSGVGYLLKDRVGRIEEFLQALDRVADGGVADIVFRSRRGPPPAKLSPGERPRQSAPWSPQVQFSAPHWPVHGARTIPDFRTVRLSGTPSAGGVRRARSGRRPGWRERHQRRCGGWSRPARQRFRRLLRSCGRAGPPGGPGGESSLGGTAMPPVMNPVSTASIV